MFNRILFLIALLLVALALVSPAVAGGTTWSIWLYDPQNNRLVRVFIDGTSQEIQLTPPQGYTIGDMTFSPSGNLMAMCLLGADGSAMLAIYDVGSATTRTSYALPPDQPCMAARGAFDEAETRYALATLKPQADPAALPGWMITVINSTTGAVIAQLDSAEMAVPPRLDYNGLLPLVRWVDETSIAFTLLPFMAEGSSVLAYLFVWNPEAGAIYRPVSLPSAGLDVLANGEAVWLANDPAFPQPVATPGPGSDFNVVRYQDNTGNRTAVFNDPGLFLWNVQFIDDGRKLLIQGQDPANGQPRALYLDRSGVQGELPAAPRNNAIPAPLGYLTWTITPGERFEISQVWFAKSGELQPPSLVWSSPTLNWIIVWHAPNPLPEALNPFPAVTP